MTMRSDLLLLLVAAVLLGAASEPLRSAESPKRLARVVGRSGSDLILPGDTLLDIAFRNGVGFEGVVRLNPGVDTWIPDPGTVVQIPSRTILPSTQGEGLVINVPEMRLFDFTVEDGPEIMAAAVGDPDDPTPTGDFRVRDKRTEPIWYVPKSIRQEKPELPAQVPPGPENPLGSRWMRIGESAYGIHGTHTRWSIGREATHGCVRLYESDIQELFNRIPEGTRLQIVYQPYKWGVEDSRILFEAHPDRYDQIADPLSAALAPIRQLGLLERIDIERVSEVVEEARGIPVVVGSLPPEPGL